MASLGQNIYNFFSQTLFGSLSRTMEEGTQNQPYSPDRYGPSPQDVLSVKEELMSHRLPLELVDTIIDHAEYWPHVSTVREGTQVSVRNDGNRFMLRSYPLGFLPGDDRKADYQMTDQYQARYETLLPQPWAVDREVPSNATDEVLKEWAAITLPRTERPCRKIVFTIISHDQGWGGGPTTLGPYDGSFTWFDVGIEEMSACKEAAMLEAWEKAPWPQFRLHYSKDSQNSVHVQNTVSSNPSRLVCSLRTLHPTTVLKPTNPGDEEGENQNNIQAPRNDDQQQQPGPSRPSRAKYEFKHELCPTDNVLQRNVVASRNSKTHTITWSCNDNIHPESLEADELHIQGRGKNTARGDYVRNMKIGDCVTVWAKARFSGWINVVDKVGIDVYWAV